MEVRGTASSNLYLAQMRARFFVPSHESVCPIKKQSRGVNLFLIFVRYNNNNTLLLRWEKNMGLNFRDADFSKFPHKRTNDDTHVQLGDIHGNALKLIYVMMEEGVLTVSKEDYKTLRDIYKKDVNELTSEDLDSFKRIISNAEVSKKKAVTLIGDELADRGSNDYFTLLVLQKLSNEKVNIDIMLSNHSAEFIRDYDHGEFTGKALLGRGQGQSLGNMHHLILNKKINESDVRKIVEQCYIPKVKAIGYTLSPKGEITLFSHAPIGLETVEALAKKFKIPYNDKTPKELFLTIDAINAQVTSLFQNKQLARAIDSEPHYSEGHPISPKASPLKRLVWNRQLGAELITETSSGIKVKFVHGHIGDGATLNLRGEEQDTHENLDTSLGKSPKYEKTGEYNNGDETFTLKHLTRQSSDFTALELTNEGIDFIALLSELTTKTDELIQKGTKGNPKYKNAAKAAEDLISSLTAAVHLFYNNKSTPETFNSFEKTCKTSIKDAQIEFVKHRGWWHNLNPILKGILKIVSIIPLFAAIIHATSKQGYRKTVWGESTTESAEKLQKFEVELEQTVFKNMKEQLKEIKEEKKPEVVDRYSPLPSS